ncbi:hypothetical protein J7E70_33340 [Variovorax paradoxus]|nr:hypothetical protein [Variovorax paradoxus]MBT2305289.1 hypothetical protein [Variovorax paradoxus]
MSAQVSADGLLATRIVNDVNSGDKRHPRAALRQLAQLVVEVPNLLAKAAAASGPFGMHHVGSQHPKLEDSGNGVLGEGKVPIAPDGGQLCQHRCVCGSHGAERPQMIVAISRRVCAHM